MIGSNNGIRPIQRALICLFLFFYLNPKCTVLCDEAKKLKSAINFCEVPTQPPHTNITIYECTKYFKNEPKSCVSNGIVFESTVIKITCDSGYFTNGEDTLTSVCHDNEWVPPIKGCIRKCKKLNPINVHLECFHKNISIPCDEKYLLPGMTVRPTCKYLDAPGFQTYPGQKEMQCQEDGNWDNDLLSCVQDCGLIKPTSSSNDSNTLPMPWDVFIYREDAKICFGTIISPRVIVTSEFCIRTDNSDVYNYTSINQNPLNPKAFKIVIANGFRVHFPKLTWINLLKYTLSKLNPFKNHIETLYKVKEIRSFNRGKLDKSFFHDVMIVILEKEINFNSHIHPACVQWENPNRVNIKTGTAKVQQFDLSAEGFTNKDYSFLSHDACQENPSYPCLVFNWVTNLYDFDKGNRNKSDVTAFKLSSNKINQTAIHEGKLFCLELQQDQLDDYLTLTGSGVVLKEEQRYFIRGVVGERFYTSNNETDFKRFMKEINYIAGISYENFLKNISDAIISGSFDSEYIDETVYYFNYNVTSLLRNHLKAAETGLQIRSDRLATVTDIADYVDEIKRIVAEVDPYYNPGTWKANVFKQLV